MAKGNFFTKASTAVPVIGQGLSALFQGIQNRKSRKWSEKMYGQQTQFSRQMYEKQKADQIAFWNMQNQYNAPSAEMNRLKAAGLNPALMYGSGAQANRAGDIGKPSVQGASVSSPQTRAAQFDGSSIMMSYNQTRIADKQMQLLEAQRINQMSQALKNDVSATGQKLSNRLASETLLDNITTANRRATAETYKTDMLGMERDVKAQMFRSGRSLKGAIADQMFKELRNKNMKVQRAQIFKAIENVTRDINLKKLEEDLRRQTGQSFNTGTIIGPLIRAIKAGVDAAIGYDGLK